MRWTGGHSDDLSRFLLRRIECQRKEEKRLMRRIAASRQGRERAEALLTCLGAGSLKDVYILGPTRKGSVYVVRWTRTRPWPDFIRSFEGAAAAPSDPASEHYVMSAFLTACKAEEEGVADVTVVA